MRAQFGLDRKIDIDATGPNIIVKLLFCNAVIDRVSTRDMETLAKRKEPWMEPVIQLCTQPEAQLDPYVPPVPPISLNVFEAIEALSEELYNANVTRHRLECELELTQQELAKRPVVNPDRFTAEEILPQAFSHPNLGSLSVAEDVELPSTQPDGNMATAEPESILPSEY